MARQLTEQLEREVSAEELLKQTKSAGTNKTGSAPTSAPSAFDTSYTPNYTPNAPSPAEVPPPAAVTPPPAGTPPAAYSPETAATVHGADWHASPPENKPTHE
jgi:hypothetical protein